MGGGEGISFLSSTPRELRHEFLGGCFGQVFGLSGHLGVGLLGLRLKKAFILVLGGFIICVSCHTSYSIGYIFRNLTLQ